MIVKTKGKQTSGLIMASLAHLLGLKDQISDFCFGKIERDTPLPQSVFWDP